MSTPEWKTCRSVPQKVREKNGPRGIQRTGIFTAIKHPWREIYGAPIVLAKPQRKIGVKCRPKSGNLAKAGSDINLRLSKDRKVCIFEEGKMIPAVCVRSDDSLFAWINSKPVSLIKNLELKVKETEVAVVVPSDEADVVLKQDCFTLERRLAEWQYGSTLVANDDYVDKILMLEVSRAEERLDKEIDTLRHEVSIQRHMEDGLSERLDALKMQYARLVVQAATLEELLKEKRKALLH